MAGLSVTSGRLENGALICEYMIPLAGNDYFHALNVTEPRVMIIAFGPVDAENKILYHGQGNYYHAVTDVTATTVQEPTPTTLTASGCGTTYGCARAPCKCDSDCAVLALYKLNGMYLDVKISVSGKEWVGMGFNEEVAPEMIGAKGVICQKVGSQVQVMVFSATQNARPNLVTAAAGGVKVTNARLADGKYICEFSIPYNGNSMLRNLNRSEPLLLVAAYGNLLEGTNLIDYHGRNTYLRKNGTVVSSTTIFEGSTCPGAAAGLTPHALLVVISVATLMLM